MCDDSSFRALFKNNYTLCALMNIDTETKAADKPEQDTDKFIPVISLKWELSIRCILLAAFIMLNRCVPPHERCVTATEFTSSYRHPRQASLVPTWLMILIIGCTPPLLLWLPALAVSRFDESYHALSAWSLANCINVLLTEALKITVGRPRPDFLYRCFPDGRLTDDLRFTGDSREINEGRKSFPSGHSSYAFCSLGFVSIWLYGRRKVLYRHLRSRALTCVNCASPLLLAAAIAVSRWWDHHHHWEDVLAGSLLGFLSAYCCHRLLYYPVERNLVELQVDSPTKI